MFVAKLLWKLLGKKQNKQRCKKAFDEAQSINAGLLEVTEILANELATSKSLFEHELTKLKGDVFAMMDGLAQAQETSKKLADKNAEMRQEFDDEKVRAFDLQHKNEILAKELGQSQDEMLKIDELLKSGQTVDATQRHSLLLTKRNKNLLDELANHCGMLAKIKAENVEITKKVDQLAEENVTLREKLEKAEQYFQQLGEERTESTKSESANECSGCNDLFQFICNSDSLRSNFVEDLRKQTETAFNSKQYESALELCKVAIEVEENGRQNSRVLGGLYGRLAMFYGALKSYKDALEAIDKAIAFDSSVPVRFYRRELYYSKLDEREKAIEDLLHAAEMDPNDEDAMKLLDNLLRK
ncbi:hypothetical protein M3Y97_01162900 [Aphelenchoides bicaudatus]|nr:hypothetical protein M3Y97_01162900 [Aphelenchoides bicaudatus]